MADNTVIGLRAAIKSLKDVVAPAIDADNPLAVEQLRMVCGYLAMVCERLPYRSERVCFELGNAIGLATALLDGGACVEAGEAGAALTCAFERAGRLHSRFQAPEQEIQGATTELTAAISAVVRCCTDAAGPTRRQVERTVLAHSKAWLDVQRAWFLPLGFDSESATLASLSEALAAGPANGARIS